MSVSIYDIRDCIQEWFSECMDSVEIAQLYAEIKLETEKQLEWCIKAEKEG